MCSPSCGAGADGRTRDVGEADRAVDRALRAARRRRPRARRSRRWRASCGSSDDLGRASGPAPTTRLRGRSARPTRRAVRVGDDLVEEGDDLGAVACGWPRRLAKRGSSSRSGRPRARQHRPDVAVRLEPGEEEPAAVAASGTGSSAAPGCGAGARRRRPCRASSAGRGPSRGRRRPVRSSDTSTTRPAPVWRCSSTAAEDAGQRGQAGDVVADAAAGVERVAVAVGHLHATGPSGPRTRRCRRSAGCAPRRGGRSR